MRNVNIGKREEKGKISYSSRAQHVCPRPLSNNVIDGSIKTLQHSIKNISRNIKAVFFKLGIKNVHRKRNKMTPVMPSP